MTHEKLLRLYNALKKIELTAKHPADQLAERSKKITTILYHEYKLDGAPYGHTPEGLKRWARETKEELRQFIAREKLVKDVKKELDRLLN